MMIAPLNDCFWPISACRDRLKRSSYGQARPTVKKASIYRSVAGDRKLTQVFNCFCSLSEQENTG
jgi:hypothetical protein